ncbi:MAG: hypothetical protein D6692_04780 [Planctomycetota bacterium]|nr:MAG: hypothetical protein D6692_04780 [Planctomycetota bacterium]
MSEKNKKQQDAKIIVPKHMKGREAGLHAFNVVIDPLLMKFIDHKNHVVPGICQLDMSGVESIDYDAAHELMTRLQTSIWPSWPEGVALQFINMNPSVGRTLMRAKADVMAEQEGNNDG